MTPAKLALLPDRGVVRVAGDDAEKLLQGIITSDMALLALQPAIHAALLTPQGKILFDFFVVKARDGLLLEAARDKIPEFIKRLGLYKLRAKVTIDDVSGEYAVAAAWEGATDEGRGAGTVQFQDPRLPALGTRLLIPVRGGTMSAADLAAAASPQDYHAHRITLGVPEGGKDYAFGDAFPHEADLDQLNGVSFDKGCFVGQEVVSRMQHRGAVRKRVVPVEGAAALTPGAEVKAGAAVIGTIGSVAGAKALALVRLDRAAEAKSKGEPLTAGGVPITLVKPSWATFAIDPAEAVQAP